MPVSSLGMLRDFLMIMMFELEYDGRFGNSDVVLTNDGMNDADRSINAAVNKEGGIDRHR